MRSLHQYWGWSAVVVDGVVGMWGILLAWRRRDPTRSFRIGVVVATVMMLGEVATGVVMTTEGAGDQHVFYAIVIVFVFVFAYIYRLQLARRPALSYGLLFLFVAGLGLRTVATFGVDF